MNEETLKLVQAILYALGIIAYTLIITHYLPESAVWKSAMRTLHALKITWEGHRIPAIAYSLRYEVLPIVSVSLLLNVVGWGITSQNPNILYLDMAGTAVASFLLGPWWGAIIGILTNIINAKIYPSDANVVLVPWMLVNLTGGIFWGLMARTNKFRRYVKEPPTHILAQTKSHLWYLFWFGVIGASIMAVAGATVSVALGDDPLIFAQSPVFGVKVQQVFIELDQRIRSSNSGGGSEIVPSILSALLRWAITTFRYIPDKTISAAVGLLTAKYMFPLFEQTLIGDAKCRHTRGDNWLTPATGILLYTTVFPWSLIQSLPQFWLWYLPYIMLLAACVFEFFFGTDSKSLIDDRTKRLSSYIAARCHRRQEEFFGAIVVAVLISSLVFMSGLFFVGSVINRGTIAFSFLKTILAYFVAFYLLRLSMRQWAVMMSSDRSFLETQLTTETRFERAEPTVGLGQQPPKG
ncbi:MAG: hypothetical protein WCF57_19810 [Pyrinomonadaceae bacterium]